VLAHQFADHQTKQNEIQHRHTGLEDGAILRGGLKDLGAFLGERAKGGVGLIVTGGISPNRAGRVSPFAAKLSNRWEAHAHKDVTGPVHEHGGKVAMQILHSGRYVGCVCFRVYVCVYIYVCVYPPPSLPQTIVTRTSRTNQLRGGQHLTSRWTVSSDL
jgi:hypothetical protein